MSDDFGEPLYGVNYHDGVKWLEAHGFRSQGNYWVRWFCNSFGADCEIRMKYYASDCKKEPANQKWACNIVFLGRRMDGAVGAFQVGSKRKYPYHTREFHEVAFCETPREAIIESITRAMTIWNNVESTVNELLEDK